MDEFKPEVPKSEKPYNKYEGEVLYSGAPTGQESTDPLSNDLGHENRGSLEPAQQPDVKHSIFDVLRKKKVSIPIIGTVATAAAAAAIYVGVSRLSTDNSSKQGNQPVATASVTPGATASPETSPSPSASATETEPTAENILISPELIKNPDELVNTFFNRMTEWNNAGSTPENAKAALLSSTETVDENAARIAAEYDKMFTSTLLIKGWESNPALKLLVDTNVKAHKDTVALYDYTLNVDNVGDPADKQPYFQGVKISKIISVEDQTDKSVVIKIIEHNYDNSGQNRVGEALTGGITANSGPFETTLTFTVENNSVVLSDMVTPSPMTE